MVTLMILKQETRYPLRQQPAGQSFTQYLNLVGSWDANWLSYLTHLQSEACKYVIINFFTLFSVVAIFGAPACGSSKTDVRSTLKLVKHIFDGHYRWRKTMKEKRKEDLDLCTLLTYFREPFSLSIILSKNWIAIFFCNTNKLFNSVSTYLTVGVCAIKPVIYRIDCWLFE